ncbi:LINE-1 reverse transcriptase-like [Vitis vinifera]|uniref:LINE-1 reverse transcriptase-like n=1 Tax=Vitis vinifera TaxID=29760 RepID=A0A438K027_VITVI|nr:LINE-1 reverse transcriptase-like [Vitis vinifera]
MGCAQVDTHKGSAGIGHPITHSTVPAGARAREACLEEIDGWTDGVLVGASHGSTFPDCNFKEITDEALKEEAARYTYSCTRDDFSFGERALYSSSSRSGWVVTMVDPARGSDVGGLDMDPLRMIMTDGREAEVLGSPGMVFGTDGKEAEKVVGWDITEERNEGGEQCWQSSCLARFSRCLGMPTEGFEGEILFLLKRMKERNFRRGRRGTRMETKIQEMTRGIIRSIGVGRFLDWGAVDSRGSAGGIVDGFTWTFTGVYGPTKRRERENLWNELGAIHGLWNGPWCVAGDFNAILSPKERSRGGSFNSDMRRFAEVIEELQLKDLTLFGGPFTWSGGVNNQTMSRLDRFLVNEGRGLEKWSIPFRFENMWLKVEGFKDLLKAWWEGDNFNGAASFVLAEKLKVVKTMLKEWNRDVFGRVEYRKNVALDQMQFWDAKEKINRLTVEEMEDRREAREEYKKWVLLEECEQLQRLDADALEVPFTEEEVHDALVGCSGDKAPGPDGFTMSFWQFAWDFVKEDVMRFFREFHEHGKFVKRLNTNFLVLIPKKMGAEDLREFRPISLVGSLYKWLAKVLANRLKRAVGKVVSKAQGAFVEGRQILDAVLIANEAIDSILKNNENGILCKLDIEKAYDNVDWSFLLTLKGLRQGDPLSPYLFVIAMEVFSSFLNRAMDNGYISGCQVKGRNEGGIQISHLLFADDTLVFCQASQDQLTYLSWLLMWFEAASGMRINLDKSELIPVGRVVDIDDLALDFGCKVGSLPSTYLGLPLGAPFKSVAMWDGVEERFRKRLTMWKKQYLSKGGRATLIRSTLSNLPIYYMSVLRLPSSVRSRLEQIQRDFLWGGGSLERKPHLVRWKVVCLSKKKGGLGIKCLSNLNKALLSKWNWRYANEREALWNQVIRGKYGEDRGVGARGK